MLILGGLISVAYASSTIITDTGITTTNLTILGTCTGCAGEGSYSHYTTIALNTTTAGNDATTGICSLKVGTDGAVLISGGSRVQLVYVNGTTAYNHVSFSACNNFYPSIDQSSNGKYKLVQDGSTFTISVYKSGQFLQNLGINTSQCSLAPGLNFAISSDAKYIATACKDSAVAFDRIVILQGT